MGLSFPWAAPRNSDNSHGRRPLESCADWGSGNNVTQGNDTIKCSRVSVVGSNVAQGSDIVFRCLAHITSPTLHGTPVAPHRCGILFFRLGVIHTLESCYPGPLHMAWGCAATTSRLFASGSSKTSPSAQAGECERVPPPRCPLRQSYTCRCSRRRRCVVEDCAPICNCDECVQHLRRHALCAVGSRTRSSTLNTCFGWLHDMLQKALAEHC